MSDNKKPWLLDGEMYQYNLGWLIDKILSFESDLATAIDLKTIKYADPIQWDITTQYTANTVVIDPKTGVAYMSKVPVPAGVDLDNSNYWVKVFDFLSIYNRIMDGIATNERRNDYASKDYAVNDLVWYSEKLYRVARAIAEGAKLIPGTNLTETTIESCLERYYGKDRFAQVANDTVNVSGDYTVNAGDISETADHVTIHAAKDMVLDADTEATLETPVCNIKAPIINLFKEVTDKEFYGSFPLNPGTNTRNVLIENDGSRFLNNKWGCASKGRIIIMGDSFAGNWQGYENGSYADRLCKLLGADNYNIFSFGGGGFIAGDNENHLNYLNNFKQTVEPAISSVKNEITVFIVQGGLNDGAQNFDAEKTAVTQFLTYVQSVLPDACILGITCLGLTKQSHDTVLGINGGFHNAGVRNTPLAWSWLLGRTPLFASDNIHPNNAGHEAIARAIYAFMYGADIAADDFGYFYSGGGGGVTITPYHDRLNIVGYGNITGTARSVTIGTMNVNLAPANYTAFPIYADSGLAYMSIDAKGTISLYSPTEIPSGFGNWRVNTSILMLDK